jgi:hypothetical protein
MGKIAGYKIVLQFDTKTLVGYRSASMDIEADMADATTGASTNQWKEFQPLFKGASFSVSGLYDPTEGGNQDFDSVAALLIAGTAFTAKYGNTEVGSKYYSASAYIQKVHQGADYNSLSDYTVDVVVTGAVTPGTVS